VLDLHSDPFGWLGGPRLTLDDVERMLTEAAAPAATAAAAAGGGHADGGGAPASAPHQPSEPDCLLVIDGLSSLLRRHPPLAVVCALRRLRRAPGVSALLAGGLHADLHAPHVMDALARLSTCAVELSPMTPLQASLAAAAAGSAEPAAGGGCGAAGGPRAARWRAAPLGLAEVRLKQRSGRLKSEAHGYALLGDGAIEFGPPPPEPQAGAAAAARLAAGAAPGGYQPGGYQPGAAAAAAPPAAPAAGEARGAGTPLAKAAAGAPAAEPLASAVGGMRLGLSQEEAEARRRVVLPYQHRGEGRTYGSGDARDYLPPAAGGRGAGAGGGGLGHILYVRDSSEEADSDEDPDADLDI